ncbi:hypothetical protein L6R50_28185 [Myxococcota bacterium]|nr:hypothetical protein [Myxococcota bacterium]
MDERLREPLRRIRRMYRRQHSRTRANLRRVLHERQSRVPPGLEGFLHDGLRVEWWRDPVRLLGGGALGGSSSRRSGQGGRRLELTEAVVRGLEEQARAHRSFTNDVFVAFTQAPLDALGLMAWTEPSTSEGDRHPSKESPIPGIRDEEAEPGGGAITLPDPATEPRAGVCHWEFSI